MAITQKDRFLKITTPLGEDFLLLVDFHGEEGISKLFHFDLNLGHEETQTESKPTILDFDTIVGKNVTVRVALPDGGERFINGHIASFGQGGRDAKFSYYRAILVPWLWFLSRDSDCRIFQNMTVPEIVKQVFDKLGFKDHRDALSRTYTKWDYCTQYHETHLNFVSRLMEEEGIFYFFEHEDGKHTLVLADSPSAYQDCSGTATIPFVTEIDDPFGQTVTAWQIEQECGPATISCGIITRKCRKKPWSALSRPSPSCRRTRVTRCSTIPATTPSGSIRPTNVWVTSNPKAELWSACAWRRKKRRAR
jgi:type VI secretion system VgrG family protein